MFLRTEPSETMDVGLSGLTIWCRVNVTLDMILGVEDIFISWFVGASLFVCCMIHCKHLR